MTQWESLKYTSVLNCGVNFVISIVLCTPPLDMRLEFLLH